MLRVHCMKDLRPSVISSSELYYPLCVHRYYLPLPSSRALAISNLFLIEQLRNRSLGPESLHRPARLHARPLPKGFRITMSPPPSHVINGADGTCTARFLESVNKCGCNRFLLVTGKVILPLDHLQNMGCESMGIRSVELRLTSILRLLLNNASIRGRCFSVSWDRRWLSGGGG